MDYTVKYEGKTYKNMEDLINSFGLSRKTFYRRKQLGWTMDEALKIPLRKKDGLLKKPLYNYKGKLLSTKQISEITGISQKTINKRFNRGWTINEVMEIPLMENYYKKEI